MSAKVIGIGNILRRDDGVGVFVVEELKRTLSEDVEIIDAGTMGYDIVFLMEGARKIILIDSFKTGGPPGQVYRLQLGESSESPKALCLSLHEFRLHDLLAIGRQVLEAFPEEIVFYGVEPEDLSHGYGLSPSVERAFHGLLNLIKEEVQR